jgi:hypothetical protein
MPHDREAEAEPAVAASRAGIGLAEAVEHVGQEFRADAGAVVRGLRARHGARLRGITGVLLAGLIAALGLFIIPARRSRAKAQMRARVAEVRGRLSEALRAQFRDEIARSLARLRDSVGPYTRFVRAEGDKLRDTEDRLGRLGSEVARLRERVAALAA